MPSPATSSSISAVKQSGSVLIDALIHGLKWGGSLGSGVALSYSFPWTNGDTVFLGYNGSSGYSTLDEANAVLHYGLNVQQQQAASAALQAWANVANIQFSQVTDTASNVGDIRFGFTSANNLSSIGTQAWGWAHYPSSSSPVGGDIWLSTQGPAASNPSWSPGSENYQAIIHEVGHALGLKHSFEDGTVLPASLDSNTYTVMSYNDPVDSLFRTIVYKQNGAYSWQTFHVNAETPMVLDIAAMQYIYGANKSFHTSDDVYTFDPHIPFVKAIWDAGGNDSISVSNFTEGCVINLVPGSYSSIRILPDAAPANYTGPTPTYDGSNNFGIAFGAIIENAVGGKGNDVLTGNDVANRLTGGGGNDQLDGGNGTDTAVYAGIRSQFTVSKNGSGYSVTDSSGTEGADAVVNIERLQFADAAVALDTNGVAGEAYRIYQAAFDRVPDLAGLGYWIRDMDKGSSLIDVASGFIASPEFQKLYGAAPSHTAMLDKLYQNVLHRTPDQAGYAYWIKELDSGQISAAGILASFSESVENQLQVIGKISNGIDYLVYT
ncbi:DUF4214 domain-containing protein [Undibacterium sp. TJN25]|uniref:DUF4214 domain-containing protein n=1 Tax=Undibacterium sp. TJN25 TaxID=3413056 RepID=UPI003BF16011